VQSHFDLVQLGAETVDLVAQARAVKAVAITPVNPIHIG